MPKITIREIDNTGAELIQYSDYVVLVPALTITYTGTPESGSPTSHSLAESEFSNIDDFNKAIEDLKTGLTGTISHNNYENDIGYIMVRELLKLGMTVLYTPYSTTTVTDNFFKKFEDRGAYDIRFITLGGITGAYSNTETASAATYAKAVNIAMVCAGNRGDAVALVGVADTYTSGSNPITVDTSSKVETWIKTVTNINTKISRTGVSWATTAATSKETYGSYSACFWPKVNITFAGDTTATTMPAEFAYLSCFAKYINQFKPWYAMAGSYRGLSPYALTPVIPNLGDNDSDILAPRDTLSEVAVNLIRNVRPYGYVVWGNRTMHPISGSATSPSTPQLLAADFLNIRQLCCTLKKELYRASKRYTFDPNSDTLWFNFRSAIKPTLEDMKHNEGVDSYTITQVPTNKKALFVADIAITPVEAVEDFDLTVYLEDTITVVE